jgi:hypothetical protein
MAALSVLNPSYVDWMQALDPDGQIAPVVELLSQSNEIMADITWAEGNLVTGHRTTVRTGIPSGTWRRLYEGVDPVKTTRATITDTVGMLETYNDIDKDLADLGGNAQAFRLSEARGTIEGLTQQMADTLFYGNIDTNPERFMGLAPRYNSLSAGNADNIINGGMAGGQTDGASIWLVVWHPETIFGIVPKGLPAGLQVKDYGQTTLYDANQKPFEGYRMHFQWKAGLCLKDWRYVVRIANIDRSLLTADASSGANLPALMYDAMMRPPQMPAGARPVWYMDRTLMSYLGKQLSAKVTSSTLTTEMVGGIMTTSWHGIPIRRVDRLAVDEARVA